MSETFLGIELGSTRIKAVLIDKNHKAIASGGFDWANRLENGFWTYSLDYVQEGLRASFGALRDDSKNKTGGEVPQPLAIGISAMMHGYLVFDKDGKLLVPFRTWRCTNAEPAAKILSEKFNFNIPVRWSIAHLYQAILDNEPHVKNIAFITTLAGYVHWKLTGEKTLGIGDASGMFPVDSSKNNYNEDFLAKFDALVSPLNLGWRLRDILPKIRTAGDKAGALTQEGAAWLDGGGTLAAGIPLCPPEGDAGTGMVATNSVAPMTGNVSAGTSIFAMVVLEKELSRMYPEIDMVTTPAGPPVAMAHCNNCTSDIDAWARLFRETIELAGADFSKAALYDALYSKALEGDASCGGLLSYNYYGGEPVTGLSEGRPLFVRMPDSPFSLADFMRSLMFSAIASLKIGIDILTKKEHVRINKLLGHGGFFKTKTAGQKLMAAALDIPVAVMESAGEGGAWGIALLAAYMSCRQSGETLEAYLEKKVFTKNSGTVIAPDKKDAEGFETYMKRYTAGLELEKDAVRILR